jgi:hypothetical protein
MTLLLLHHKIKKCQIKKIKGTDRPIKDIFNFQYAPNSCSPTTFVSTVMAHLIEELLDRSVLVQRYSKKKNFLSHADP